MGDVATGIDSLAEARRIAEEVGYPQGIVRACLNLGSLLGRLGRLEESWEVTRQGYAAARHFGIQRALGSFLAANMALHLIDTGHWEEADHLLDEVLKEEASAGFRLHRAKGQLETARGNFAAAREHLELARHASPSAAERIGPLLALTDLAIWQGRPDDARTSLAEAGRWFDTLKANSGRDDGLPWWEIVICYAHGLRLEADCAELARAHRSAADVELARRRAEPLIARVREMTDEREQVTYAPYGLVPPYAAVGEAEFSRLEGRSDPELWRTAATLWERLPLPYQAAYARFREAEALLTRHGPRPRIERAIRAAGQSADRLGAAPLRREIELLARRGRLQLAEPTDSTPQSTVTPTQPRHWGSPAASLRSCACLPTGAPTVRSAKSCSSLPRPPASTSPESSPSWASPAAARRPRSPTASTSSRTATDATQHAELLSNTAVIRAIKQRLTRKALIGWGLTPAA
jgi:tetratricopeptide (TPR) repeat protein